MAQRAATEVESCKSTGWHILRLLCHFALEQKGQFQATFGSWMRCRGRYKVRNIRRRRHFKRFSNSKSFLLCSREPYSQQTNFLGITHCFVDRRAKELPEAEKRALQEAGVHVVTILYLQACLQEDTLPSVKDFLTK